ncbi:amidohydrolase [Lutispora sp.]|uniref:amidohydrolase n=1 Tax=Lutispora sp. TaxID=2828727 RepID=UPI00356ACFC1
MKKIFSNGKIATMEREKPFAEGVVVSDGKIIFVGSNDDVLRYKDDDTQVIDLKGRLMVPGFIDSHMHLLNLGFFMKSIDLSVAKSIENLKALITDFIKENSIEAGRWVLGRGWNQDHFDVKVFPTRYDLDDISKEHPIVITRACGHAVVVNSKALELCGINRHTKQVEGGSIDLDHNGEPNGIFRENAIELIKEGMPKDDIKSIKDAIMAAQEKALSYGLTSVQSDDLESAAGAGYEDVIEAYRELVSEGKMKIRLYEQCLLPTMDKLMSFYDKGYYCHWGDEQFKLGPLKILTDGSLGARTAYLTKEYNDSSGNYGIATYTQDELDKLVFYAHERDMSVAIHCIGDKAMYMAFESIEKAKKTMPGKNVRHSIVHCQITDEKLLERFRELDVIAHVQPIFLDYDLHIVEDRIGTERAKWTYNWKTLIDKGVNVAFGSDCPVEPCNVMHGIYAAVTRKDLAGCPENGWLPEQKISVEEALFGFTLGAAYASFEEKMKGSIKEGKLADFTVLSEDIFEIEHDRLKDVEIAATIVNGEIMWGSL